MDQFLLQFLQAFLLLFVAMDVIGNIPVFVILTRKMKIARRRKGINRALLIASILLVLFLLFGVFILKLFSISLGDFKIAGGVILGIIGLRLVLNLRMLEDSAHKYQNAIIPMATPLVTGPGAITAVIINVDMFGYAIAMLAAAANLTIAWLVLTRTDYFNKLFGRQGADMLSRIFGLILIAIGVGYIRGGIL
jgi:multiple antibiotic resistance protein